MTSEEYLSELYGRLRQRIPEKELESIMKYYEEYFDEAGPQREAEVMAELGSPEDLSRQVLSGRGIHTAGAEYRYERVEYKRSWTAGKVVALVLLFPIWLSLLVAIAGLIVGLVGGIGVGGLGLMAGGVFSVWCGFTAIFTPGVATTLFFCGQGLLLMGLGLLMVAGAVAIGRGLGKAIGAFCRWLFVGRKVGVRV